MFIELTGREVVIATERLDASQVVDPELRVDRGFPIEIDSTLRASRSAGALSFVELSDLVNVVEATRVGSYDVESQRASILETSCVVRA